MTTQRLVIGSLVMLMVTAGCAKRPATTAASAPAPMGAAVMSASASKMMSAAAPTERDGSPASAANRVSPSEFAAITDLKDIHFDFDKYVIRNEDAQILDANAAWLQAHPNQLALIEGHGDERGTNEYNVALGERRAKATKNYLSSKGVADNRITIISYGEERPLCAEHNEACWAKNRRSHFLVKQG